MDIELRDITTFVAAVERGSVNRAAALLHLSQPAVTRRIQRLEAALEVTLLDRRARPPALTPAGKVVLEHCQRVLQAVEALRTTTAPGSEPQGEFRLGVATSLADLVLAETADHVRRAFPRLRLRLTTAWSAPLLEQVQAGALEMAVVYWPEGTPPGAHTASQFIAAVPLVFVAPREHRMPRVVDLAAVATEGWVLNPAGCGFRTAVQELLDGIDASLQVAVEAHGVELQLALVARGAGVSLVPKPLLHRSRVHSQVQAFRIHGHDCCIGVWLVSGRLPTMFTPVVTVLHAQLTRVLLGAE